MKNHFTFSSLCNLAFSADKATGSGPAESKPADEKKPEAKPKATIEEKLKQSQSQIETLTSELTTARATIEATTKERDDALTEVQSIRGQFDAATQSAKEAQDLSKDLEVKLVNLTSENAEKDQKLEKAAENTKRLETLCGVKGINSAAAVPTLNENPGENDAQLLEQYQGLKGAAKTDFLRKNKSALQRASGGSI